MIRNTPLEYNAGVPLKPMIELGIFGALNLIVISGGYCKYKNDINKINEIYKYVKKRICENWETSKKYIDILKQVVTKKYPIAASVIVWSNSIVAVICCAFSIVQFVNITIDNSSSEFRALYNNIHSSFIIKKRQFKRLSDNIKAELKEGNIVNHIKELMEIQSGIQQDLNALQELIKKIETKNKELEGEKTNAKTNIIVGIVTGVVSVAGIILAGPMLIPSIIACACSLGAIGVSCYNSFKLGKNIEENKKTIQAAYELKQEMETVVENLIKNTIRQYENYSHQFSETDRETLMKRLNENETSLIENLNSQIYF